jgi:tetratricopeptide (TPR) repeat protein
MEPTSTSTLYSHGSRSIFGLLLFIYLMMNTLLYSPSVSAIGSFSPTPAELALLPPFCGPRAERWGNDISRPEVAYWIGIFGKDYQHMHHYCDALLSINRAQASMNAQERGASYSRALNNLEYTQKAASAGFVLWPDVLHNRARIERSRGDMVAATSSLREAIKRNADYAPPYAELADIYVVLDQRGEARKVLEEGLARQPDSRLLQRRLGCLDDASAPGCH